LRAMHNIISAARNIIAKTIENARLLPAARCVR